MGKHLACFHPGVIAAAAPVVELGRSVVFVLCDGVLGLAGESARTANALEKEALALKHGAPSDFLDMLAFVLR